MAESLAVSCQALIALCRALGATEVGGPLSSLERKLLTEGDGEAPAHTLAQVREAIQAGEDPLGEAFCRLRPARQRRPQGAFFTDPEIVQPMVSWVLEQQPAQIVDAGCGSGRFAIAACRDGFQGAVLAIDTDPLLTLVTRANCAASDLDRVRVFNGDFLSTELPKRIGPRAFIGNPPYVRHHQLTPSTKAWAKTAASHLGVRISGLAGLHALFFLAVAQHSRVGDSGCFVTASEWLDVGYGDLIRRLLSRDLGGVSLGLIDQEALPFKDAMATAVVVTWRVGFRSHLHLQKVRSPGDLRLGSGKKVARARLRPEIKWSPFFAPRPRPMPTEFVPLRELASVHRGVVTGANRFFVLREEDADRLAIKDFTRPCVARANEVFRANGLIRASTLRHRLLDLGAGEIDHAALSRYLAAGEARNLHRRYICAHRRPWWRIGGKKPPDIIATYMARRPPAFAANPDACQILNVLHGIHFRERVDDEFLALFVRWLNQNAHLLANGRTYHGGLKKFEPSEFEAILVPPLTRLPDLVAV